MTCFEREKKRLLKIITAHTDDGLNPGFAW